MSKLDRLHSYPKVWNLGHPAIAELFDGEVVVQEKVDGSQFTFGVINGVLHCRSKGATIHLPTTDKLFRGATETAQRLFEEGLLVEGWQYRGEALCAPKHNSLTYERAPRGNVILFDIDTGLEDRISQPERLAAQAALLGLEIVPTYTTCVKDLDAIKAYLDETSCLGGAKVEGVVIKNYARWGRDGKMLMGKLVSDDFKETHAKEWSKSNPAREDVVEHLREAYRNERRWEKAIEHRRDAGALEGSPRDIGPLLKEIVADVEAECATEIADALFKHFWPEIKRGITYGFAEWYKARLAEKQFAATDA